MMTSCKAENDPVCNMLLLFDVITQGLKPSAAVFNATAYQS
jgi:hypothetical protein